jgi:hypothetical protein
VIQSDTAPFTPDDSAQVPPVHKNLGRSSMSPLTALALSFNNLLTKKTDTTDNKRTEEGKSKTNASQN